MQAAVSAGVALSIWGSIRGRTRGEDTVAVEGAELIIVYHTAEECARGSGNNRTRPRDRGGGACIKPRQQILNHRSGASRRF